MTSFALFLSTLLAFRVPDAPVDGGELLLPEELCGVWETVGKNGDKPFYRVVITQANASSAVFSAWYFECGNNLTYVGSFAVYKGRDGWTYTETYMQGVTSSTPCGPAVWKVVGRRPLTLAVPATNERKGLELRRVSP